MTKIAVTAATGQLGRLVVADLIAKGTAPTDIVAIVRDAGKAAFLAEQGVEVRVADYDDRAALEVALAGVTRLLLISASEPGKRLPQHQNVIDAAVAVGGIEQLAYTGVLNSPTSGLALAEEHVATEAAILASGLPHTLLRNGWYIENYAGSIPGYIGSGELHGAAGTGTFTPASRADFAAAAAAVLTGDGHVGQTYELGGDQAISLADLAAIVGTAAGTTVTYVDLPEAESATLLEGYGLPAAFASMLADSDTGIARGHLRTDSGDLARLIGRPTQTVAEVVQVHVDALKAAV